MNINEQPFWKDAPEASLGSLPRPLNWAIGYFSIATQLVILLTIAALLSFQPILMWVWIAFYGVMTFRGVVLHFKNKSFIQTADEIQRIARQRLNASHIGSALHMAGHPLLQRDQPIVLALVGDQLNLHSYESPVPLDTIPLQNIQAVQTVSYDDDRVPHVDVIDSAAQAIQLTFIWREQTCTCLFRRMKKMRPIDWYQALQQARLQAGLVK